MLKPARFIRIKLIVLFLGLFAGYTSQAQYFNDVKARTYGYMNCSGNWIDYDLDGDTDLLLSGEKYIDSKKISKHTSIFKNANRDNSFPAIKNGIMNVGHSATDVGDYDNDGDEDILISGINSSGAYVTYLYRNNRSAGFQLIYKGFTGVAKGEVRLDDFNNDGNKDVIICGETKDGSCVTELYINQENNRFRKLGAGVVGVKNGALDLGDYDLDGDLDIAICGENNAGKPISAIYTNDGGKRFMKAFVSMTGVRHSDIKWGDYDHDGLVDIVLCGETADNKILTRVYGNLGDGTFISRNFAITGVKHGHVSWGDYDHDADLDLLITGESYRGRIVSAVFRNDRESGFVDIRTNLIPLYFSDGEFSDYDCDGDLDLFISGLTKDFKYISRVYRNDNRLFAVVEDEKKNEGSRKWSSVKMPPEKTRTTYFYLVSSCYCIPNSSYEDYGYHAYYSQVFKLEIPYERSINYFDEIINKNDNWGRIKGAHFTKGYASYKEAEKARQQMISSYREDGYNLHYVIF